MSIAIHCDDCGRTWPLRRCREPEDSHGSRPLQCPHCYALIGRTAQGDDNTLVRVNR